MARIFIQPITNAKRRFKTSDISFTRVKSDLTNGTQAYDIIAGREGSYIQFNWNQYNSVQAAMLGMHERAREGVVKGTNRAAERTRDRLVSELSKELTLDPFSIAEVIEVTAEATERNPAAQVSIKYRSEPLNNYEHRQDDSGVYARVRRSDGERYIPAAFVGEVNGDPGIFQRIYRGGERVGRLPIRERSGPSVMDAAQETPGFIERETEKARTELVRSISQVRNEIVSEFNENATFGGKFTSGIQSVLDPLEAVGNIFGRVIRAVL